MKYKNSKNNGLYHLEQWNTDWEVPSLSWTVAQQKSCEYPALSYLCSILVRQVSIKNVISLKKYNIFICTLMVIYLYPYGPRSVPLWLYPYVWVPPQ